MVEWEMAAHTIVEVIPWIHNLQGSNHEDVIRYIRGLAPGSSLGIELTRRELAERRRILARFPIFVNNAASRGKLNNFLTDPNQLAFLDIIHECQAKGITVIPLENARAKAEYHQFLREVALLEPRHIDPDDMLTQLKKIAQKRERATIKIIQKHLEREQGERFPGLYGPSHAWEVRKLLGSAGVSSRIRFDIFRRGSKTVSIIKQEILFRKALAEGKMDEARRRQEKMFRLAMHNETSNKKRPTVPTQLGADFMRKVTEWTRRSGQKRPRQRSLVR